MTKLEYYYFGRDLGINEQLVSVHKGEDGMGYQLDVLREFFMEDQAYLSGDFQLWYYCELYSYDESEVA